MVEWTDEEDVLFVFLQFCQNGFVYAGETGMYVTLQEPIPHDTMTSEQVNLYDLNRQFTGRDTPGFPGGYDPSRLYRLHRRNRAEVWKRENREKLLDSIRNRRYIPAIIVHETIENGKIHRDILDGGNRTSAVRRILEGGEFELSEEDRRTVERYPITVVVLRDLTPQEIRTQFKLLNKVVRVTPGHLYHMSAEDSPLVAYAYDIMTNTGNALRPRILELFSQSVLQDNASRGALTNIVALCAGAQHGVQYITTSFDRIEPILGEPINRELIETRLSLAFSAIARADTRMPAGWVRDGRVARGEFNVGRFLGVILYDLLPHGSPEEPVYEPAPTNTDGVLDKWARVIAEVRTRELMAILATSLPSGAAGNINLRKLRRISKQVDFYLQNNRMPTEQEIKELLKVPALGTVAIDEEDSDDDTQGDGDAVDA